MKELVKKIHEKKQEAINYLLEVINNIPFQIRPQKLVVFISDENEKDSIAFFLFPNKDNGNKMEASDCCLESLLEIIDMRLNKPVSFFLGNISADLNVLEKKSLKTTVQVPFLERGNFATLAISVSGEDIEIPEAEFFSLCIASVILGTKEEKLIEKNVALSKDIKELTHPYFDGIFKK